MKHKLLATILFVLAAVLLIVLLGGWAMFGTQLTAAGTVTKLADGFYSMEYIGDYGFDGLMEEGGVSSDDELAGYISSFLSHGFYKAELSDEAYGCSTISVKTPDGAALFGRNFDWHDCTAMTVKTIPAEGYASISTSNLDFLGFGEGWLPEGTANQIMSLAAVYVPLDGMNEKGFCVADLMINDGEGTHQDTEKPDLTTTTAIRLLLDRAANVSEALALLEQYDMNSSAGIDHHLALSDTDGNAVVVEYIDNKMVVTETKAVTNFYLAQGEKYGTGSEQSKVRFETLSRLLDESSGVMDRQEVIAALDAVDQKNFPDSSDSTQWSIVFSPKEQTAFYRVRGEEIGTQSLVPPAKKS